MNITSEIYCKYKPQYKGVELVEFSYYFNNYKEKCLTQSTTIIFNGKRCEHFVKTVNGTKVKEVLSIGDILHGWEMIDDTKQAMVFATVDGEVEFIEKYTKGQSIIHHILLENSKILQKPFETFKNSNFEDIYFTQIAGTQNNGAEVSATRNVNVNGEVLTINVGEETLKRKTDKSGANCFSVVKGKYCDAISESNFNTRLQLGGLAGFLRAMINPLDVFSGVGL